MRIRRAWQVFLGAALGIAGASLSSRRDIRWLVQTALLVVLGMAVIARNLLLRG